MSNTQDEAPTFSASLSNNMTRIASIVMGRAVGGVFLGMFLGLALFVGFYVGGLFTATGTLAAIVRWMLLPISVGTCAIGLGYAGFSLGYTRAINHVLIDKGVVARFVSDLLERIARYTHDNTRDEAVKRAIEDTRRERRGSRGVVRKVADRVRAATYPVVTQIVAERDGSDFDARPELVDLAVDQVADIVSSHGKRSAMVASATTLFAVLAVLIAAHVSVF